MYVCVRACCCIINMTKRTLVTAQGIMWLKTLVKWSGWVCVCGDGRELKGVVSTLSEHLAEGSSRPRPCHSTGPS